MKAKIALIKGDGIGPEIVKEAKRFWKKLQTFTNMNLYLQI